MNEGSLLIPAGVLLLVPFIPQKSKRFQEDCEFPSSFSASRSLSSSSFVANQPETPITNEISKELRDSFSFFSTAAVERQEKEEAKRKAGSCQGTSIGEEDKRL